MFPTIAMTFGAYLHTHSQQLPQFQRPHYRGQHFNAWPISVERCCNTFLFHPAAMLFCLYLRFFFFVFCFLLLSLPLGNKARKQTSCSESCRWLHPHQLPWAIFSLIFIALTPVERLHRCVTPDHNIYCSSNKIPFIRILVIFLVVF